VSDDSGPGEATPPRPSAQELVCRLVGVGDGDIGRLWKLWSGDPASPGHEQRRALLVAIRQAPAGEQVMANLVTFGVLRGLSEAGRVAAPEAVVELFRDAGLRELTAWADDPGVLAGLLSQGRPGT
jgi:hypothetical protein